MDVKGLVRRDAEVAHEARQAVRAPTEGVRVPREVVLRQDAVPVPDAPRNRLVHHLGAEVGRAMRLAGGWDAAQRGGIVNNGKGERELQYWCVRFTFHFPLSTFHTHAPLLSARKIEFDFSFLRNRDFSLLRNRGGGYL